MSVVNDVLKNLDQRHAQEKFQEALPYRYEIEKINSYWLPAMLLSTLIACSIMAVNVWLQVNQEKITINLPEGLFNEDQVIRQSILTKVAESLPVTDSVGAVTNATPTIKDKTSTNIAHKNTKSTVQKTLQTQAMEKAVNAFKSGDDQTAKLAMVKAPKAIQDEIRLRLMVKESPLNVLPYIQQHYPNFLKQEDMLAMAAQAEQRSGKHLSAINLYTQLISLRPKDARWRAGIAISLEASGEKDAAEKMYFLAMKMPNLPSALYRFSQTRLELLR